MFISLGYSNILAVLGWSRILNNKSLGDDILLPTNLNSAT